MYNDQLVYKVVICVFFGISLGKEKVALISFQPIMYCIWIGSSVMTELEFAF